MDSKSPKSTWENVTLWFATFEASRGGSRQFTRKEMVNRHLNTMVGIIGSVGATPDQTMSKVLQDIRDAGIITFVKPGIYEFIVDPNAAIAAINALAKRGQSRGERMVGALLTSMGIKYTAEKTFKDLRCKGLLRFDFYFELADSKFAIEFDGEQHHFANNFFGGIPKMIETNLRDKIKAKYAQDNGITLIRIRTLDAKCAENKLIKEITSADNGKQ